MANDRHSAIYNARIPQMPSSRSRFGRAACPLFIILLLATYSAAAGNWASADEQLAAKIASVIGPGTAFIDFANRSSLTRAQTDEVRRGLLTELANHGVRFANAEQAAASVKVTFSEDLQNYVWVAEIHQSSNESAVVMVSLARAEPSLRLTMRLRSSFTRRCSGHSPIAYSMSQSLTAVRRTWLCSTRTVSISISCRTRAGSRSNPCL